MEKLRSPWKGAKQYMGINRALNGLLRSAEERSEIGRWKKDGVGTCSGVEKIGSEVGLDNPVGRVILDYRRGVKLPPKSRLSSCPYFIDNIGCAIPELKAPICASVLEDYQIWKQKFGIDGVFLNVDTVFILHIILSGNQTRLKKYLPDNTPTINEFYNLALDAIGQMTKHVRQFPVTHPFKNSAE